MTLEDRSRAAWRRARSEAADPAEALEQMRTLLERLFRPDAESVLITLNSSVPSKKNALKGVRCAGQDKMYKPAVKKAMGDLVLQAKMQWAERPPVVSPVVHFYLEGPWNQDRDGMETTLYDVLKKAGVLHDDSIRYNNGLVITYPAVEVASGYSRAFVRVEFVPEDIWKAPVSTANTRTRR